MGNERITEDFVRNHFKSDPLFSAIKFDEQKASIAKAKACLAKSSKNLTGKIGSPEFIISFPALITSFLANSGLSVQQVVAKKIIANKVASWDAMDVLEKRAISESHKVTPSSLAKAYADLEDELTTAQESGNQDADIYEAEAAKLKMHFVLDTAQLDFYSKNHRQEQLRTIRP